jgi:uncharacterized protein YhjY with autotransporter beta-barrel domain
MKLFLGSIVVFAFACFTPLAFGQVGWVNSGSDNNFNNAANWSTPFAVGVKVPGPTDEAVIFPGFTANPGVTGTLDLALGGTNNIIINSTTNQSVRDVLVSAVFGTESATGTVPPTVNLNFTANSTFTTQFMTVTGDATLYLNGNYTNTQAIIVGTSVDQNGAPSGPNISGPGTLVMNAGTFTLTDIVVGDGTNGTANQNAGSNVTVSDFLGLGTSESGLAGTGIYNLNGGTLTTQDAGLIIGFNTGTNGTFNQTGGTLNVDATSEFGIGFGGTGQYTLSGGTANIYGTMDVGDGASGTFTQSGNSSFTAAQTVNIGVSSTGLYSLLSGTADFQSGFIVGSSGQVNQSGGTLTSEGGVTVGGTYTMTGGTSTLDSLNVSGDMELNGGTLLVSANQISVTGSFNLGGGTLKLDNQVGNTFTYNLPGALTGSISTIDASATNVDTVNFSNSLVGAGGIAFVGSGPTQFNFTMSNSYGGLTSITSGTLNTIQQGINFSSGLNIGSGGVVNLNINDTAAGGFGYTGAVTGVGVLNAVFTPGAKVLLLTDAGGFDGSIVLGAGVAGVTGTLQIYNGTYTDITDNSTNSDVVVGGTPAVAVSGTPVSGTVVLSGANSYTGTTTINSNFTVQASTFYGDVVNGGVLATLGTQIAPSELTINNSVLNSTGTLHVFTNGASADLYNITGSSPSSLAGVINVQGTGTGTYTIVQTAAAGDLLINGVLITGTITAADGLTTSAPTSLFSSSLSTDGQTLTVVTTQGLLSTYATNPTQLAVANALDPLTQSPPPEFVPLLAIFNSLTGPEIGQLEEDLAPTQLQVVRNIAFENSTFLVQRIDNTLGDIRGGYTGLDLNGIGYSMPGFSSGLAHSLNSMLASNAPSFHTSAPNGVNYYPDTGGDSVPPSSSDYSEPSSTHSRMTPSQASSPTSYDGQVLSDSPVPMRTSQPPTLRTSQFTEFVAGDAVLADINQTNNMPNKASYTAGDIVAGVGFRVTSNLTVGVLFDFNHTNAKTDSMGSRTTANSYTPGLFATFYEKNFYLNGLFAFGYNQYDYNQNVPMVGTTHGNPDGQQYTANIDGGYDFHPDKNWVVGPTAGLTYTHLNVDSFSESGAPLADLNVNSQSVDSLRSRLGGHLGYAANMGNVIFQPTVSAQWQHEFLDNGPGITSSFASYSTAGPFTIPVASPNKDSALLSVGATATLNNSLCFYLNYTADVGGDYLAQSIMGGLKASF